MFFRWILSSSTLADEGEQRFVDLVLASCAHSVRSALENLELGVLDEFRGKKRRVCDWHDLVIVTVKHQCGHIELGQVGSQIRLGESLDAKVTGWEDLAGNSLPDAPQRTG